MSGTNNTKLGDGALNNTEASSANNTAIGAFNSYNNTIGFNNTSVGSNSLFFNTIGSNNTALGAGSLCNNNIGNLNTAVGSSALEGLSEGTTTGNKNVAIGAQALYSNSSDSNTAIGVYALENNTTGTQNVALGYQSGNQHSNYNYNTLLGAGTDTLEDNIQYATAIGYQAIADASNTIMMGGQNNSGDYPTVIIPGELSLSGGSVGSLLYEGAWEMLLFCLQAKPVMH